MTLHFAEEEKNCQIFWISEYDNTMPCYKYVFPLNAVLENSYQKKKIQVKVTWFCLRSATSSSIDM